MLLVKTPTTDENIAYDEEDFATESCEGGEGADGDNWEDEE